MAREVGREVAGFSRRTESRISFEGPGRRARRLSRRHGGVLRDIRGPNRGLCNDPRDLPIPADA
jgi:hypothetical protein